MATVVGIDIGSQKTMIVGDDGEIVRTDTGSIAWYTLIAFLGRCRLIGEEALPQITGDNTIAMINSFIGKSFDDIKTMEIAHHLRCKLSQSESKIASFSFLYNDEIHWTWRQDSDRKRKRERPLFSIYFCFFLFCFVFFTRQRL